MPRHASSRPVPIPILPACLSLSCPVTLRRAPVLSRHATTTLLSYPTLRCAVLSRPVLSHPHPTPLSLSCHAAPRPVLSVMSRSVRPRCSPPLSPFPKPPLRFPPLPSPSSSLSFHPLGSARLAPRLLSRPSLVFSPYSTLLHSTPRRCLICISNDARVRARTRMGKGMGKGNERWQG